MSGVVTEKKALQGMRFMPGDMLYQVTDLSSVWVDRRRGRAGHRPGQDRRQGGVKITAYPEQGVRGPGDVCLSDVEGRDADGGGPGRARQSRPAAQARDVRAGGLRGRRKGPVLTVPDSAVIDTGTRRIVLVQLAEGRFEPREVELGGRGENFVEVVKGVREGEQVVVAANFLIDAESNLKAAIGGLGGHAGHGSPAKGSGRGRPRRTSAPAAVGHKAEGSVDGIDAKAGTVSLNHGAIPTSNGRR